MDLVYTYVNGADAEWQRIKTESKRRWFDASVHNADAAAANRFRDQDELRYSLRSVATNLPWIRTIYIVVASPSQVPRWLQCTAGEVDRADRVEATEATDKTDKADPTCGPRPRVQIVYHADLFGDEYAAHLPTYNSHAIEVHLHRIAGLSDVFLYCNDDFFFHRPMAMSDFVDDETGRVAVFLDPHNSRRGTPTVHEIGFRSAWKNTNRWLDARFEGQEGGGDAGRPGPVRKKLAHACVVVVRTLIERLWSEMPRQLERTSAARFRSIHDYNLLSALYSYYALYRRRAFVCASERVQTHTVYVRNLASCAELDAVERARPHMFCIEDDIQTEDAAEIERRLGAFLARQYPVPSPYEQ
jgi:hypothetical protein